MGRTIKEEICFQYVACCFGIVGQRGFLPFDPLEHCCFEGRVCRYVTEPFKMEFLSTVLEKCFESIEVACLESDDGRSLTIRIQSIDMTSMSKKKLNLNIEIQFRRFM